MLLTQQRLAVQAIHLYCQLLKMLETVKSIGVMVQTLRCKWDNTHVYAASGVYTVKIESKVFGGFYFNNGGDKAKIVKWCLLVVDGAHLPQLLRLQLIYCD